MLLSEGPKIDFRGERNVALLHQMECKACPRNTIKVGGKLEPTGSDQPLVYMLGHQPSSQDGREGEQFTGEAGDLLRDLIPNKFKDRVRFNNITRSYPGHAQPPTTNEIECCRPSIQKDIEQTKPQAIFGFGGSPLAWVTGGFTGIKSWRGRKMPVKVGNHVCWYYVIEHPNDLIKARKGKHHDTPSDEELMFKFDLKRAFAEVERLPKPIVHTQAMARANTEIYTGKRGDLEKLVGAFAWAFEQPLIGWDYETNGLRPFKKDSKILTVAFATGERSIAFALDHSESQWSEIEREQVGKLWCNFLRTYKGKKVAHNLVFELEWTGQYFGLDLVRSGQYEDTATQACILDERKGKHKPGCFALDFLTQQYFGFSIKDMFNLDKTNLDKAPIETVLYYNGPDARYAALLYGPQEEAISLEGVEEAYALGLRRVPTVALTQIKGIPLGVKEVQRLYGKYTKELKATLEKLQALPVVKQFRNLKGEDYSPTSNQHTLVILRDILKRTEIRVQDKWSKEWKESTDESVLLKINHPFTELLLRYRKFLKRLSVYVEPCRVGSESSVVYADGMLHTQFNTLFAESGRLSSEGPNLQNWPKRDKDVGGALTEEDGQAIEVRKQVEAEKDCLIIAVDQGQIEARCIAMFTKDERFCKALWERYDVHQEWAERLAYAYPARVGGKANLKDKKAMKTFRTDVKNQWTFPLFFGARLQSAAGYLKMPEDVIAPLYEEFWEEFSGVKKWQEQQVKFYKQHGYVECLTGRRRRGPLSINQILNSPVQGTAAEIMADSMSTLSETGDPVLQPEINVHDDLTFLRIPEKQVDTYAEKIIEVMLFPPFKWINVPITVEMSIGKNWLEMEEVATFSSDEWYK